MIIHGWSSLMIIALNSTRTSCYAIAQIQAWISALYNVIRNTLNFSSQTDNIYCLYHNTKVCDDIAQAVFMWFH